MFIDEVQISVASGKGGAGVIHFRREKYVPRGGPDGGDGGKGADVVFVTKPHLNTLSAFRNIKKFRGEDGSRGGGNNQTGRSAENLIINVPPGTLIYDVDTGNLLGDLVSEDDQLIVCKGGRGGRGNAKFATSKNKAPRIAEKGEPGEERNLRLELKLIADIGIVGVPNAGKSTFLSVVTNAKPKIGAYPFTTISPNLGVAELDHETSLVLADIPGLIEGAHQGIGLGHDFLRHIQRTRVLIHILDGIAENPLLDFSQINSELALFDPELSEKPQVVVFNKMDLPDVQNRWPEIKTALQERGYKPIAVSAVTGKDVRPVLYRASKLLKSVSSKIEPEATPIYRVESDPREFRIERLEDNGGWLVIGESIERAAAMTYWEYDQSVRRFQHILDILGIEEALRSEGAKEGDTVIIGDYELEWQD
jgi:GTP-binding protein